jgi:hypothetical protein
MELKTTPEHVARSAILTECTRGITATEDLIVAQTQYRLASQRMTREEGQDRYGSLGMTFEHFLLVLTSVRLDIAFRN